MGIGDGKGERGFGRGDMDKIKKLGYLYRGPTVLSYATGESQPRTYQKHLNR